MSAKEDALYSRFNPRGRKSFKPIDRAQLADKFPEYAKIGLPAHKAALDGNVEALKDIYSAFTADGVPSRDVNGATPLHLAVRGNRTEAVKWLLRFTDLSPTTIAKHGETPCHVAAVLGNTECLKAMVGADTKGEISVANDNSGFTPLHLAIVKSRNEAAKMLISELGVRGMGAVNESGITAAHVAASAGNTEVLKVIANKNKKYLCQPTTDGTTPLYYAAQEGRLAAVKYLHEKGRCDLSTPSNDGRKPIHAACQCGHTHVVKYIVSKLNNSAIFEPGPEGATTLHYAASTGQVKTARWLIDSDVGGTLVNCKDSSGDTPAHDAADNGKIETLKLLLENGAHLYAINNDGNTPYSLALSSQQQGMADFVMSFASNAPQKPVEGPSQKTIFDMQGEVDVVDFQPKETVTVEAEVEVEKGAEEEVEEVKAPVSPNKKDEKKTRKKEKKEKEKKQKDKKGKRNGNSSSFLGSPGAALLAMPTDVPDEARKSSGDDKVLNMTDEELDMFKEESKANDDANTVKQALPSSDGSDIVVSYGDRTPPAKSKLSRSRLSSPEQITTPDYSTVAEIERAEKKKEKKKMGRKNSKPLQRQKHEDDSSKNVEGAGVILSGPQMGFKPQFHTNPLQGYSIAAPPTPPPTPATGFSSSATSEVGIGSAEDEDMPYDMYSHDVEEKRPPDNKGHSEEKEERKERGEATEGDDVIENPVTNLDEEDEDEEEEDKTPVLKKWPPPKTKDYKPAEAKMIQPSGENVLKKWQANSDQTPPSSPVKPDSDTVEAKGHGNVLKKWPPAYSEPKVPSTKIATTRLIAKTTSPLSVPPPQNPPQEEEPEKEKVPAVKLHSVQKRDQKTAQQPDSGPQMNALDKIKLEKATKAETDEGHQMNELDKIKLKKASKASASYSSPSSEATSGAGNELTALLKIRQNKI